MIYVTQKERILGLFKQYKKLSVSTLYELCQDISKTSVRGRVSELYSDGQIDTSGENTYTITEKSDLSELSQLRAENEALKKQLHDTSQRESITDYTFKGNQIKFGLVTDTHLGSLKANEELLNSAYDIFEQEGIEKVFHAGDITDGEHVYRGQEFELKIIGFEAQLEYLVNTYPERESIETHFILGNHDESFWRRAGADIGLHIAKKRTDMIYLGMCEADVNIQMKDAQIKLRLWHPTLGTAYAISYQSQRYIESLSGGKKPNILAIGHFHKAEYLFYRNIHAIQGGCCEFQTRFMASKKIAAMMGFWVITADINEDGIVNITPKFYPDYES